MSEHDRFHNALRILRSIDRHELTDAGVVLADKAWAVFRDNPFEAFIRMPREQTKAIWIVIEGRQR